MNEIGIHGDGGRRTVTSTAALARAVIHETAVFCRPSPSLRDARIQHCVVCGRPIAPVAQLDAFAARTGLPRHQLNICVGCRWTTACTPGVLSTAHATGAFTELHNRHVG
jgi:hypothetical protein